MAGHADTQCYVKLAMLAPMFSKTLGRAQEVEQGDPLELRCKVEASPSATVKWSVFFDVIYRVTFPP